MRYDTRLPSGAKLLFGEITALCNKEGYCWAGNAYFAGLYGTSERTIINWINSLKAAGHIKVELIFVPGRKEVQQRRIWLAEPPDARIPVEVSPGGEVVKIFSPPCCGGSNSDGEVVKYASPPGSGESNSGAGVVKKFSVGGEDFFRGVVKNSSGGGEKIFTENITNNNKIATATAPPRGPPSDNGTQPEAAAVAAITWERLKDAISSVDRALVFDGDFYAKAIRFMNENGLDLGYPAWLYRECENKNPSSFDGLYFRLFFAANLAEKYRVTRLPDKPARPPPEITCPVCESTHGGGECPVCGLSEPYQHEQYLEYRRGLFRLSPERRAAFIEREDAIYAEYGVFKSMPHIRALKEEFGFP